MKTALAISPHLDDAVFSAGGLLARLASDGWRVFVATVFTASVPNPEGFALACQLDKGLAADLDYMALRRAEDAAACAIIGAEPRWLPFCEAPHRGYETAAALFAGLHASDEIVAQIAPAISDLLARTQPARLFAPQAVGAHVDHVAVVDAHRGCPSESRKCLRPPPYGRAFGILHRAPHPLRAEATWNPSRPSSTA